MKKSQMIYQYIRSHGAVSKQDIVIGLQYSLPTITSNLQYLTELGLVDASKKIENTGGRNATAYTYVKEARHAMGVYLTAHHANVVAVDLSGNVVGMKRIRIKFDLDDQVYLKRIGAVVEEVKRAVCIPTEQLIGVGIAVPSLITKNGELVYYGRTLNFTGKTREEIARYIPYTNRLFHDSIVAGFAEVWVDRNLRNAFYLSLNNSVGGAVVIQNGIYEGDTQKGGEAGHMTILPEGGEQCYCGKYGCLDTLCGSGKLECYANGSLENFFMLLKDREAGAMALWERYMDYLAIAINNIRMLFDCTVIIGGYVGAYIGDYMDDLCKKIDERNSFGDHAKDYVMPCRYKVESAAAGAAIRYIDEFIKSV